MSSGSDTGGKKINEQQDLRHIFEPYFEQDESQSIFGQRDSVIELMPLSRKKKMSIEEKDMIVQRETRYKLTH